MDEFTKDIEEQITKAMAQTFHFTLYEKSYKCDLCGKLFYYHYVGKSENYRMIQHFNNYHAKHKIDLG